MQLTDIITDDFKCACNDYFYLLERNYPERGVLKLTGDRYKLSRDQRSVLYRGISSGSRSAARRARLVNLLEGSSLIIDGYNVLFTVLNYRLGRAVFISTDGILRDAGSLHGKLRDERLFNECIADLFDVIVTCHPARVDIFLDSPVSSSDRHQRIISSKLHDCGLKGECNLVHSADREIKTLNSGILATSDTVLIEKTQLPITDISRYVLETKFKAELLKISEFINTFLSEE